VGHINIEIKAKCSDHEPIKQILLANNADFMGLDHQTDTYYQVKSGRLKLREGNIENTWVYYQRESKSGPKQSNVTLYKSKTSTLKEILEQALGVLVVVEKKREIYYIDNVKFHLDKVKKLGSFVEFKAFDLGKKVFLYNPIPDSIFTDELTAMNPTVINGDLSKVV